MTLPHNSITPIPNNEPDAVPALWNTRYQEIDANFDDLDSRLDAREIEINAARGGGASLGARLNTMESDIGGTSPDMQNALTASVKYALDMATQANHGVRSLKQHAQQQGVVTIANRGVVTGCTASKSITATRNLSLTQGTCFANGRIYAVSDSTNAASVPSNTGGSSVLVHGYLFFDSGLWRLAVTPIGQPVPDGAIRIYNIAIPANSTDATDPLLTGVTLTDVRRIEVNFPVALNNPVSVSPLLVSLPNSDYHLDFDVISAIGAPCPSSALMVASRSTNGFMVYLASAADTVVARWKLTHLAA